MSRILRVRFKTPVNLGTIEHTEWSVAAPGATQLAGKIGVRPGDPQRSKLERPGSVVFECRIVPTDHYDVIVPEANIAGIHVTLDEKPDPKQETKKS